MFKYKTQFIMVGLATAAALASAGCHKAPQDQGSAQVSVHALSLATDVKAVDVAVSGTGIPSPMDMPLFKQTDGSWKGLVSHIPVGSANRTFTAKAYDSTAKTHQIYGGAVAGVTITKNNTADVIIVLTENPNPNAAFTNHAPVIDGLTVSSVSVGFGDHVAYTVTAHDPDTGETALPAFSPGPGNGITFTTTVVCGTFGPTPTDLDVAGTPAKRQWSDLWTAPADDGTHTAKSCQLNMTVTDKHGAMAVASVTITVSAGPDVGAARVSTIFESYPVISNITSSVDPLSAGATTNLNVLVTMSDAETPSFSWSVTGCNGIFTTATTVQSPSFQLEDPTAATSCNFIVAVSGPAHTPTNGTTPIQLTTTGHLTVNVGATVVTPGSPGVLGGLVIDLTSQSEENANGGDIVGMFVKVHEQSALATITNIVWACADCQDPKVQTDAPDKTTSTVSWKLPNVMPAEEDVKVTFTDSAGATASYTFIFRSASRAS